MTATTLRDHFGGVSYSRYWNKTWISINYCADFDFYLHILNIYLGIKLHYWFQTWKPALALTDYRSGHFFPVAASLPLRLCKPQYAMYLEDKQIILTWVQLWQLFILKNIRLWHLSIIYLLLPLSSSICDWWYCQIQWSVMSFASCMLTVSSFEIRYDTIR